MALGLVDVDLDELGVARQRSLVLGLPRLLELRIVLGQVERLLSVALLDGFRLGLPGLAGLGNSTRDVVGGAVVLLEVVLVVEDKAGQRSLWLLLQLELGERRLLLLLRRRSLLLRCGLLLWCSSILLLDALGAGGGGGGGGGSGLEKRACGCEKTCLDWRGSPEGDRWQCK